MGVACANRNQLKTNEKQATFKKTAIVWCTVTALIGLVTLTVDLLTSK